ncbi:MAG: cellulase family glycosylhydrolase [Chloroflexi bacterium]|nr:cellulase family glycosylhydrolase [Chloroflexota bacterium]
MNNPITRREFLKLAAALASGAIFSSRAPFPTTAASVPPTSNFQPPTSNLQSPSDFVTIRGDQFYLGDQRFPIRGFNYYPRLHPWKIFNIGEWEPQVTERELKLGAALGANVVRIFVDWNYSLDNVRVQQPITNYYSPITAYVDNVRECIEIAGRLNLKVILTLLDSMDFSMYLPQNVWIVEEYVKAFVPLFANDPRLLCWDLQNEPDRAIRTVGNSAVIPFFRRISSLVRQLDPQQLQTIGMIDRLPARYFPDWNDWLDFFCFHYYDKADRLNALVQFYKTQTKKPMLLQEYGLATGGPGPDGAYTEQDQAAHYQAVLRTLDDNKMCGSVQWCLNDFPIGLAGNPPIQEDSPENHFGIFRLDYKEKPAAAVLRSFWQK